MLFMLASRSTAHCMMPVLAVDRNIARNLYNMMRFTTPTEPGPVKLAELVTKPLCRPTGLG